MKRLIIVFNPNSTRFLEVERKIIEPARKLKGWMICKFEVKKQEVEKNAEELAKIIRKGDLVIAAGGDGTVSMALNAIVKSEKIATLAVGGFGNFNDYAGTFGEMNLKTMVRRFEEGRYEELYPLEVKVNKKHYRYVGIYFTVGMFAESTLVFETKKARKKLYKAKNRLSFSLNKLFKWYLINKWRKNLFPENVVKNTTFLEKGTTDYVALNGERIAELVPAEGWTREPRKFWSGEMRNRSFFRMVFVGAKALEGELPGGETEKDLLVFEKPERVFLHVEGEAEEMMDVKEILVEKTGAKVRVIRK